MRCSRSPSIRLSKVRLSEDRPKDKDFFAFRLRRLRPQAPRVVLSQLGFHLLEEFRAELFAAQIPAPLQGFPFRAIVFLGAAALHPLLELFPASGIILLNAVFTQEP